MNLVWRMHVSEHAHMDGFILVSKHAHSIDTPLNGRIGLVSKHPQIEVVEPFHP